MNATEFTADLDAETRQRLADMAIRVDRILAVLDLSCDVLGVARFAGKEDVRYLCELPAATWSAVYRQAGVKRGSEVLFKRLMRAVEERAK